MSGQHNEITQVTFAPGEILFRENEHSYHFFIIQDGQVEIYKTAPDGEKVVLAKVGEGVSVGEFAMIDRLPRSATAQAIGEVQAVRVSESAYSELLTELPDWAKSVMSALVGRVRETNEIIRRAKLVDPKLKEKVEKMEYDPDASLVWHAEGSDDLDLDDTPDLAGPQKKK